MSDDSIDPVHPGARVARAAFAPARRPHAWLLPTLFDRLRDDAPSRGAEPPSAYAVGPAQMRDIVQRDLAFLLNTTNAEDLIDRRRHPEAAASTVNFGVPALAGGDLSQRRWADIERIIRRAVHDYEPRLIPETVSVLPLASEAGAADTANVLRFEIRALIDLRPYPVEFTVHSAVDLENSRMSVQRALR